MHLCRVQWNNEKSKIYRPYEPEKKKFVLSQDVVLDEDQIGFYHLTSTIKYEDPFPFGETVHIKLESKETLINVEPLAKSFHNELDMNSPNNSTSKENGSDWEIVVLDPIPSCTMVSPINPNPSPTCRQYFV